MKIDKNKSLAELTNEDWGAAPESATFALRERHEFRRQPLRELSFDALARMLELNNKQDANVLIPYSLNRLGNSAGQKNFEALSLLNIVMSPSSYKWDDGSDNLAKLRTICDKWLDLLDDELSDAESTSDSNEYYKKGFELLLVQNKLLNHLATLERRINSKS